MLQVCKYLIALAFLAICTSCVCNSVDKPRHWTKVWVDQLVKKIAIEQSPAFIAAALYDRDQSWPSVNEIVRFSRPDFSKFYDNMSASKFDSQTYRISYDLSAYYFEHFDDEFKRVVITNTIRQQADGAYIRTLNIDRNGTIFVDQSELDFDRISAK